MVDVQGLALCGNLAKQPHGVCLVPSSFVAAGELQGLPGAGVCVIKATGKQIGLAEVGEPEGLMSDKFPGIGVFYRLLQQW